MITLHVNGVEHSTDADPSLPLLWILRDELNLTGTKFGCGEVLCGACTSCAKTHKEIRLPEAVLTGP